MDSLNDDGGAVTIDTLPNEIICYIFLFTRGKYVGLGDRHAIPHLIKLGWVSHRWLRLSRQSPELWSSLAYNFYGHSGEVPVFG